MDVSEGGSRQLQSGFGSALGAVLVGLAAALLVALLVGAIGGRELVLVPLLVMPGAVAGFLHRRDGLASGVVAGVLALVIAVLGLLLSRDSDEPRSLLEYLAAWVYPGAGLVLGNALAGVLGVLLREERED